MKNKFTNAFNDVDARYILEAEPGNSRPKASILRKKWLIAAVAAVLVAAILIPVAVAFANKAPEPGTPVIAVTETKKETPEKTETPVVAPTPTETPIVTPTPTETSIETPTPTETPIVTPTPTETPVVTPTPVETGTPIAYTPTEQPGDNPVLHHTDAYNQLFNGHWVMLYEQAPMAVFRITEITSEEMIAFFDYRYVKVRCELLFAMGFINGLSPTNRNEFALTNTRDQLEYNGNYIYVEESLLNEIDIGTVCMCNFRNWADPKFNNMCAYRSNHLFVFYVFNENGLVMDENKEVHSSPIVNFNGNLEKYRIFIEDPLYKNIELFSRMPNEIGNGSSVDDVIKLLDWYQELYELIKGVA